LIPFFLFTLPLAAKTRHRLRKGLTDGLRSFSAFRLRKLFFKTQKTLTVIHGLTKDSSS
jgi:hypothetical protein